MKKYKLNIILSAIIFATVQGVFAQITINSNEYDTSFGSLILQYSVGDAAVDPGTTGGPQNWVFSKNDFPGGGIDSITVVDPATTPFADDFPDADHAWYIPEFEIEGLGSSEAWTFFNLTENNLQWLGEGAYYEDIPFTSIRTPAAINFTFPGTYNTSWNNNYTSVATPILLRIEDVVKSTSIVDAWGTVTLPMGTFDCLRIREDEVSVQTVYALGFPVSVDSSQTIAYQWVVKNLGLVATMISKNKETNPNFTQADVVSFRDGEPATSISNRSSKKIQSFSLEQNYPNPFNPTTTISYSIGANHDSPLHVELSMYNLLGQKVATLVNKQQKAGNYSVQWDASAFAGGVYLYKLETSDGNQKTRKLILLK